jgi:hypothetical protein
MADEPLRTTTFTLTRADALAYEQSAFHLQPLGVLALIAWLAAFGAMALLVPPEWAGPRYGWSFNVLAATFIGMGYVLVLLAIALRQWRAASRRLKHPEEVILTEWPDRIELTGSGMPRTVAFVDVSETRLVGAYLFLGVAGDILILPRRAFHEEGSVEALAARISAASGGAAVDRAAASA